MIKFYLLAIKKSIKIIKEEPAILLPIFLFHIIVNCLIYLGLDLEKVLASNFTFGLILEWFIPAVLIEPIVIFWAWIIIKNIKMEINVVINQYLYGLGGILLVSMIGKPLDIYIVQKMQKNIVSVQGSETSIPLLSEIGLILTIIWMISLAFRLLTIYFKFDYLTSINQSPSIFNSIKASVNLFLRYKWVTIWAIVYLSMILLTVLLAASVILAIIIPQQFYQIAFSIVLATLSVFSTLFFFVVFMKLKPTTNLNDN